MASLRGQAQACAARAGGVFLTSAEYKILTLRHADLTTRLRDVETQLEQIVAVQGYYERSASTSSPAPPPSVAERRTSLLRRTRSCPHMPDLLHLP